LTIYTTLIDNGKYTAVRYLPGGNSMIRAAFLSIISLLVLLAALSSLQSGYNKYYSTAYALNSSNKQQYVPILRYSNGTGAIAIKDRHLTVEVVAEGLNLPTTMAFLGPNDILVLEKQRGTVQRIVDGKMLPEPLLDVNVATQIERCMCGIAISHAKGPDNSTTTTYVFLYYTETAERDGGTPIGNRLYRYELVDNKLVNPTRLLNLPATPGPRHNGGAIIIGPDNNLYVPIGDVDGHKTQAQNFKNGPQPDGTGGILRITQDGRVLPDSPLGDTFPLNLYYAYGIRNSFGITFDPITGNLWDTENGPAFGDEINLVQPGFNSGWNKVQGIWTGEGAGGKLDIAPIQLDTLVDFNGKGKYHPPQFTWNHTVGPTGIAFLNSDKLGKKYENDMFVGDIHRGNLYHFKLTKDRTDLILKPPLADKVAYADQDLQKIIFGTGFGGITDLKIGPYDGYLYIVSIGQGKIFRIIPSSVNS
jgi:aldose sugar dehydrogenase